MWKRHSIAAKKAAGDANKAKMYSKIGKQIQLAAKKWADPSMNPQLELMLQKAKYHNLPRDVVDKAIKKGSGQLKSEDLHEIVYEGYWPGGVALVIKALTDNVNRTAPSIKIILGKKWGSLWEPWSVIWQFNENGVIVVNGSYEMINEKGNLVKKITPLDEESFEEFALELDIIDLEFEWEDQDRVAILTTSKDAFSEVKNYLENEKYNLTDAELHYIAENTLTLSNEDSEKLKELISDLEEDEDVDNVYHNETE